MGTCCTGHKQANDLISFVNNCDKKVSNCEHLSILKEILENYSEWNNENNKSVSIYEYIINYNDSYSIVTLLNDYHHIINCHNNEERLDSDSNIENTFEDVYNYFCDNKFISDSDVEEEKKIKCDMNTCNIVDRNHRDRTINNNSRKRRAKLYYSHTDYKEVISQQILDQIHCYIFHTFDSGLKLTNTEKNEIESTILKDEEEEEEKQIDDKKNLLAYSQFTGDRIDHRNVRKREQVGRFLRNKHEKTQIRQLRGDNNKFVSNVSNDSNSGDNNSNNNNNNNNKNKNDLMFSFGVRYYYDNTYEDDECLDVEYNIGYEKREW
eukprot:180925_1